jgi:hypothetical protein
MEISCRRYVDLCREYIEQQSLHKEELTGAVKYLARNCTSQSADIILQLQVIPYSIKCVSIYMQSRILEEGPITDLDVYIVHVAILFANFTSSGANYVVKIL